MMDGQILSAFFHVALTLAGGVLAGALTFGALVEHEARARGKRRKA